MKKINFYEEEVKRLNNLLPARDKTIQDCWKQISELKKENDSLHVELRDESKSAKHWEDEFIALSEKYVQLENDIENHSIVELQKEKAFLLQRNGKLESDNLVLTAEVRSLQETLKDYNEYQMQNVDLTITVNKLEKEIKHLDFDKNKQNYRINQLENANKELEKALQQSTEAMILAGKRIDELQGLNKLQGEKITAKMAQINELQAKLDNAEMNNCFDEANYIDKLDTANDTIEKLEFMISRLLKFNVERAKGE
jgi:uncharacterized coiled-coil DUF342 family protein